MPTGTPGLARPSTTDAMTDSQLVTRLFSHGGAELCSERISPRAAYQEALYGRSLLLDIRTGGTRAREGAICGSLSPVTIDGTFPAHHLAGERIVLLAGDVVTATAVRELLTRAGAASVAVIVGGYAGWAAAGLPIALPVARETALGAGSAAIAAA
jgi:rhodanese-related sulfurtransferase